MQTKRTVTPQSVIRKEALDMAAKAPRISPTVTALQVCFNLRLKGYDATTHQCNAVLRRVHRSTEPNSGAYIVRQGLNW